MQILIIDDDKLTVNALQKYLEDKGHKATIANDGEQAIKKCSLNHYDLIISDLMMPGISGLSLVNVLRSVQLNTAPIIMMSSLVNQQLIQAAAEAGANAFIGKPFTPEELDEKLATFEPTNSDPA